MVSVLISDSLDAFKMMFGVVLKWFGDIWCVLWVVWVCFHGPGANKMFPYMYLSSY